MEAAVTFASPLGEWLAPLLLAVRATGFFEWYVYIPVMTLASVALYVWWLRRVDAVGGFDVHPPRQRRLWRAAGYVICFLLTNALAVAFKTLIVEEMDYPEPVWFASLVSPLHFYIVSVTGAYLWLVARGRRRTNVDRALGAYVQVGLVGGYAVGLYRILFESFSLLDPTTAVGGFLLLGAFFAINLDLWRRMRATWPAAGHPPAGRVARTS